MTKENLEQLIERGHKRHVAGLEGISGRIKFEVGADAACLLRIDNGDVELSADGADTQAVVACNTREEVARVLRGDVNPIVEALQGHLSAKGDLALVFKATLGLQSGALFAGSGPTETAT